MCANECWPMDCRPLMDVPFGVRMASSFSQPSKRVIWSRAELEDTSVTRTLHAQVDISRRTYMYAFMGEQGREPSVQFAFSAACVRLRHSATGRHADSSTRTVRTSAEALCWHETRYTCMQRRTDKQVSACSCGSAYQERMRLASLRATK